MAHLNEEELKKLIQEEVFKVAMAKKLDEQLLKRLAAWIKSKMPTADQDQIEQAIDQHVEQVDDANIDTFVAQINQDIQQLLSDHLQTFIYQVIEKAVMDNFEKINAEGNNV